MNQASRLPELALGRRTLANGLDIIVCRRPAMPIVAVNLWYHVGSKNEERRQRGFAHLFEHLMFEGSEHYPADFFKPLQRLGATVNGSTSTDRTNYFEDLPAAHLELALAMESDRMGNLLPALTDAKLRTQKDVVTNEYRQNYTNRPYGQVGRILAEALYPPSHPYNWLTIGVMEDIEAATRGDVEAFFRRFYVPANASLALVGDLDEDHALALAERYFGPIDGGMRAQRPWVPEVALGEDTAIRLHDRVELDRVYLVWPTVPHFHPEDAPLNLLADVLGRGRASRLYKKLVIEEELAQGVSAQQSSRELAGALHVTISLRPGKSRERAAALAREALVNIAEKGVEPGEITRALNGRMAAFVFALDNIGGFGGVADRLNAYNIFLGEPGKITTDFERYQKVNAADIQRAAAMLFDRPAVTLEVIGGPARTTAPPLDRGIPPTPAAAVPFRAPRPVSSVLPNGTRLWVLPRRDLPIVAATAVVAAGAIAHPTENAGLAALTTALLDEGTARFSAEEIAERAEGMGTHLSAHCGYDGAYVSMQSLASNWQTSLDLAVEVLLRPTFPEADFRRVKAQTLAALKAERDRAESLAHRCFIQALYGPNHAYGVAVDGNESAVNAIRRADLAEFHARRFNANHAAWVVAGDVDPDAVQRFLEEQLASWKPGAEAARDPVPPANSEQVRIWLIDRPGSDQAVVRVGHIGAARSTPDHADLSVFNHVLGGQFQSRLNLRLREEKGLTYGARSHFEFRRGAGPFAISASIQSDRVGEALRDIHDEVRALLDSRPPTPAEIDDARRALIEGQARHFESPGALTSRFAGLFLYGLPIDEYECFPERIAAVTAESPRAAALRHIVPERFEYVIVAAADAVLPQLRRLDWAEPRVVAIDDINT